MSSGSIKRNYPDFLKNCLTLEQSLNLAKKEVQKNNFKLISKLMSKLFECKNKESFTGISNAIISFLSLSERKNQKDQYQDTKELSFKQLDPEFRDIMKKEFAEAIKDLKNENMDLNNRNFIEF